MTAIADEAEAIAYLTRLVEIEQGADCAPAVISCGPFTAFTLIGALQLATRHPAMSDEQRELIGQVIDQLRPLFAGSLGEQLLRLGDDPAMDVPRN